MAYSVGLHYKDKHSDYNQQDPGMFSNVTGII